MATSTATLTRITELETYFGGTCEICRDWSSTRVAVSNPQTGEPTDETRPAVCPRCGREPEHGNIEIVIDADVDDLP